MVKEKIIDEVKEQKKEDNVWYLGQVATQHELVIVNKNNPEELLDVNAALVKILNSLEELKKLL